MLRLIASSVVGLLRSDANLTAENLALRQQLIVLQRSVKRPTLHRVVYQYSADASCGFTVVGTKHTIESLASPDAPNRTFWNPVDDVFGRYRV